MQPNTGQNYWQTDGEGEKILPPAQAMPVQTRNTMATDTQEPPFETINWEASENISHQRDGLWFLGFISVITALLAISVWLQQWTFTALIVVMAIALFVYTRRPPRNLRYSLSYNGLHIDQEFHSFDEFKSFGVVQQGSLFSVILMPTKRFGQALTIYFSEGEGEKIVDILGAYLPMQEIHQDMMDALLRRLRL
jgi:hypothetical protein